MPSMLRTMFTGKLHQATVTGCHLDYTGSITIDENLLATAGILPHQRVQVVNINTGARFETYTIVGAAGDRAVELNGAAARLAQPGDRIIVIAYALCDDQEARSMQPRVVVLDADNHVVSGASPA
jgi:aspartate 1-decarboxylase